MRSLVGLSIFECEQPVCVLYKVWAKRSFLFKNGISRPGGAVSRGGSTPWSGSERCHWLTWESQPVCVCGVYHWKSMKVQGVKSWIAPYFVVRGHHVSLQSPFIFGRVTQCLWAENERPELVTLFIPGFCEDPAWMFLGKSDLHFFVFSFQETFKNQNDNGFLSRNKVHLESVCLLLGILT